VLRHTFVCVPVLVYLLAHVWICVSMLMQACVCVCLCVCICVYVCICMCVSLCVCVFVCVYVCMYMYICVYVCVYMCVYMYVCIFVCVCVYICVHLFVCICVYTYVCVSFVCVCVCVCVCVYRGHESMPGIFLCHSPPILLEAGSLFLSRGLAFSQLDWKPASPAFASVLGLELSEYTRCLSVTWVLAPQLWPYICSQYWALFSFLPACLLAFWKNTLFSPVDFSFISFRIPIELNFYLSKSFYFSLLG
jgi:hypothetical protein